MEIVPFKVEHIHLIRMQQAQGSALDTIDDANTIYLEASNFAFSAIDNGEVIASAGIIKLWEGRGHAWALLSGNIKHRFVAVHRAVKRAIEVSGYKRIEMDVDESHKEAIKWAHMLGFYDETPNGMHGYAEGRIIHKFVRLL